MLRRAFPLILAALVIVPALAQTPVASPTLQRPAVGATSQPTYYPERLNWQHKKPEEVGMNPALVSEAVKIAMDSETQGPRDMALFLHESFGKEPFSTIVGPIKDRGGASGIITRNGYIVAEWGDPKRADITNSVTKTFLTTVVGLAWQKGMIRDVNDYVRDYMPPHVDLFESEHNRKIKWDHLLRQTSDWQGTLWGKPDWADRPEGPTAADWPNRPLHEPGTHFKYNDVRVNVMSLAALHVWRRSLPQVLLEEVMEPIGASSTWRWYGYENSWVEIDGQKIQSVSGGGHWGGGMFINAYDMARFGVLTLRRGKWKDRQLVSEQWVQWALTPTPVQPSYGFMNWYNNRDRKLLPSAPPSAFAHLGNGTNMVYVDPDNELVAVARWIERDALDGFVKRLLAAVKQ